MIIEDVIRSNKPLERIILHRIVGMLCVSYMTKMTEKRRFNHEALLLFNCGKFENFFYCFIVAWKIRLIYGIFRLTKQITKIIMVMKLIKLIRDATKYATKYKNKHGDS